MGNVAAGRSLAAPARLPQESHLPERGVAELLATRRQLERPAGNDHGRVSSAVPDLLPFCGSAAGMCVTELWRLLSVGLRDVSACPVCAHFHDLLRSPDSWALDCSSLLATIAKC